MFYWGIIFVVFCLIFIYERYYRSYGEKKMTLQECRKFLAEYRLSEIEFDMIDNGKHRRTIEDVDLKVIKRLNDYTFEVSILHLMGKMSVYSDYVYFFNLEDNGTRVGDAYMEY